MASEAGNAAQTPFIPNSALNTSEQATMATTPRLMEVMEASVGRLTAVSYTHLTLPTIA